MALSKITCLQGVKERSGSRKTKNCKTRDKK